MFLSIELESTADASNKYEADTLEGVSKATSLDYVNGLNYVCS